MGTYSSDKARISSLVSNSGDVEVLCKSSIILSMNAMAVFLFAFILIGVLPILTRAKGASVFMMLCVGKALMEISSDEVGLAARLVLNSNLPVDAIAKIFLMLLPALLALFVTKKAAKKKFPYHIIPSIVAGLLAGFWSVGILGKSDGFESSPTYTYVNTNITVILLVGILSTIFLMFVERPKPVKPEDGEGHHAK
jgi:hypothetical protein